MRARAAASATTVTAVIASEAQDREVGAAKALGNEAVVAREAAVMAPAATAREAGEAGVAKTALV